MAKRNAAHLVDEAVDQTNAIQQRSQKALGEQVAAATRGLETIGQQRARAIGAIADRLDHLLDPDAFASDLFAEVANRGAARQANPMFSDFTLEAEVLQIEQVATPVAGPSVADFLGLPVAQDRPALEASDED